METERATVKRNGSSVQQYLPCPLGKNSVHKTTANRNTTQQSGENYHDKGTLWFQGHGGLHGGGGGT